MERDRGAVLQLTSFDRRSDARQHLRCAWSGTPHLHGCARHLADVGESSSEWFDGATTLDEVRNPWAHHGFAPSVSGRYGSICDVTQNGSRFRSPPTFGSKTREFGPVSSSFTLVSAAARIRSASLRCGRSTILPWRLSTPASGLAAKRSRTAAAHVTWSGDGVNATAAG